MIWLATSKRFAYNYIVPNELNICQSSVNLTSDLNASEKKSAFQVRFNKKTRCFNKRRKFLYFAIDKILLHILRHKLQSLSSF